MCWSQFIHDIAYANIAPLDPKRTKSFLTAAIKTRWHICTRTCFAPVLQSAPSRLDWNTNTVQRVRIGVSQTTESVQTLLNITLYVHVGVCVCFCVDTCVSCVLWSHETRYTAGRGGWYKKQFQGFTIFAAQRRYSTDQSNDESWIHTFGLKYNPHARHIVSVMFDELALERFSDAKQRF